jgi:hypothetical protein
MENSLYKGWELTDTPPTNRHVLVDKLMLKQGILQNAQEGEGDVEHLAIARVVPKDAASLAVQETVQFTDLPSPKSQQ